MSDWTAGYVADIDYTFGYYPELNPLRARLALPNAGWACPAIDTACELGFGQGISVNIHAAAGGAAWHGTDFNPAQAGFAQSLASASGARAHLHDEAFADFARRVDLPDFDYIGLHGIWSWISDENRKVIVDFVRRKLKVGGILYASYNTFPGWAAFAPMRHLLTEHARVLGAGGEGIVKRIDGAIEFAQKLLATEPSYARANPQVAARLEKMKSMNRHYLAHEYFNRDWHPMHFAEMAEWLGPAKLGFACSAHCHDHVAAVNLRPPQEALIKSLPDPMFRESVRDFMVNQQFRRDYWVKGPRRLSPLEREEALSALRLVLTTDHANVPLKVTGSLGEANLAERVYVPVLDAMADHRPRSVAELAEAVRDKGVSKAHVMEAVLIFCGAGHFSLVQDDAVALRAKPVADALNRSLMEKSRSGSDVPYLASPVTGGGVGVGRFQQLFLLALREGKPEPADWAAYAWDVLQQQGQRLMKEGKPLESAEDNLAELRAQATQFSQTSLPVLKALQVA